MKQSVNPAVMGLIIVIVIAIIAFVGFKVFAPSGGGDSADMRKKYMPNGGPMVAKPETAGPPAGTRTSQGMSGGMRPGAMRPGGGMSGQ